MGGMRRAAVAAAMGSATLLAGGAGVRALSTTGGAARKGPAPGALIFLHGLGDTPAGWSSLRQQLPQIKPRLRDVEYVFPPAPQVKVTINGGVRMPGWFDLYDWPIGIAARDDKTGKLAAVDAIRGILKQLEEEKGIPPERVVLGGFSQGGAIALLAAYHNTPRPVAGCAALSGWLTLRDDLAVTDAARRTPLFWAHGQLDDKVLFEQQAHGVKLLESHGVSVEARNYRMGHESHPQEIRALAAFVERVLFPEDCAAGDA